MNRSTSGTISVKASSSARAREARSRRVLICGSSQLHSWFTVTGLKLLYWYCGTHRPASKVSNFIARLLTIDVGGPLFSSQQYLGLFGMLTDVPATNVDLAGDGSGDQGGASLLKPLL